MAIIRFTDLSIIFVVAVMRMSGWASVADLPHAVLLGERRSNLGYCMWHVWSAKNFFSEIIHLRDSLI